MAITIPNLDDRSYREILREALARIPVHNPQWTNFNDSDPGVTLVQLFAFMTENLLYRANQIPERNRKKFLQLLGIAARPASAARGFVTFRNERGPGQAVTIPLNLEVRAGTVPFRTTQKLEVLPIEAQFFYKDRLFEDPSEEDQATQDLYELLYSDLLENSTPAFYETVPMPAPSADRELPVVDLQDAVDGCLWIALLARPNEGRSLEALRDDLANKVLTVGVMPRLATDGLVLAPGQQVAGEGNARGTWEIALRSTDGTLTYEPLPARSDVNVLEHPGLVELTLPNRLRQPQDWMGFEPGAEGTADLPPALADDRTRARVLTWLRLRVRDRDSGAITSAQVSWIGINATMVEQRAAVTNEVLGNGNGEPDQCFQIANGPLIAGSLNLTVAGEPWYPIEDLLAADPEVPVDTPRLPLYRSEAAIVAGSALRSNVYSITPEGEICFGDGAHGRRPRGPIAVSYAYGGGRQGNVAAGAINRSPQLPAGFSVQNDLFTWGGDEAGDAEAEIPLQVRTRDRLVAARDFVEITRQTPGVRVGRAEVLPLYDPATDSDLPGVVTIMVVPFSAAMDAPQPDYLFLETICRHLQPRRLITTELHIRGPVYKDIYVSVGIQPLGGWAAGPLRRAVEDELYRFLSPLYGGRDGTGWPLSTTVLQRELWAVAARVDGVRLVNDLYLGRANDNTSTDVGLGRLELPRLAAVSVLVGAPVPLADLRIAPAATGETNLTPIPVIPERC